MQEQGDTDEFLMSMLGGDVARWSDVARKIASIMLCEESLGVWL